MAYLVAGRHLQRQAGRGPASTIFLIAYLMLQPSLEEWLALSEPFRAAQDQKIRSSCETGDQAGANAH